MLLKLLPALRLLPARAIRAIPVLLLCWSATVTAQNIKVTGKVTDDKGLALPGRFHWATTFQDRNVLLPIPQQEKDTNLNVAKNDMANSRN
jgi:hypothetical protein